MSVSSVPIWLLTLSSGHRNGTTVSVSSVHSDQVTRLQVPNQDTMKIVTESHRIHQRGASTGAVFGQTASSGDNQLGERRPASRTDWAWPAEPMVLPQRRIVQRIFGYQVRQCVQLVDLLVLARVNGFDSFKTLTNSVGESLEKRNVQEMRPAVSGYRLGVLGRAQLDFWRLLHY